MKLSRRELFAAVGYEPHAGQMLVHKSKAPRRVLACGVRWGKSTCAAMEAFAALLEPREKSIGWIVAPFSDSSERTFARVVDLMRTHFPHRIREHVPREYRLVVTNFGGGVSEMRGKTADNPTSLLGEGLDWLILDEAARVRANIWQSCLSQRLVDKKGWALIISTPRGRDWFFKLFRHARKDPSVEAWCSPSCTNPHLDPEVIEAERLALPADVFRQEYGAEFIGEDLEACDLCRGPSPDANCMILLVGDEQPRTCPECNGYIGEDGLTRVALWPSGKRHTMIIEMAASPEPVAPTELPL